MKDWPELVLGLIEDMSCYCDWLDDFRDQTDDKDMVALIAEEWKAAKAMIERLRAHGVAKDNPQLEQLMRFEVFLQKPN